MTIHYSQMDHSEFDAWYDGQPERTGGLRTRSNHAWDAGRSSRDAEIAVLTALLCEVFEVYNQDRGGTYCPICGYCPNDVHAPDCRLAPVLSQVPS